MRSVAWLTILMLAVAPLLAMFHRASVRHAVCEHGDLIEAEVGRQGDREQPPTEDASVDIDTSSGHVHSHCSVGTLARSGVGFVPATSVVAVLAHRAPVVRLAAAPRFARAVLPNAPKTSPPSFGVVLV